MTSTVQRCGWAKSELLQTYHDTVWGVPAHDDRLLYEMLILDGAQAGLSWEIILKKRDGYYRAFAGFDPQQVALFDGHKIAQLIRDPSIVRNRLKIQSAVVNARCFLSIQEEFGSFDNYLWAWVGRRPVVNNWKSLADVPARTELSDALSKDLSRRGFTFVGSTICYAFLQSAGLVNDHLVSCFRHLQLT
ncbi:MAG: DNA-3-methyladenine glycosylase I [Armatimonadetes bacterium]|nr:DNA-3-methyladenine glycosylase I [Armatimonadota bacterium]